MEKAIKKAIEGGYKSVCGNCQESYLNHKPVRIGNRYCTRLPDTNKILLDPLFWQALGKAEGWNMQKLDKWWVSHTTKGGPYKIDNKSEAWLNIQHSFIDHLAEGKDADSFFESLLT